MAKRQRDYRSSLEKYERKRGNEIVAVRLDLDTDGFKYEKWGGTQVCKPGDGIVFNGDSTYTIDAETFEKTYKKVDRGLYLKTTPVWATVASESGTIGTKEGSTDYKAGDYIVFNDAEGHDGYAMTKKAFDRLYKRAS